MQEASPPRTGFDRADDAPDTPGHCQPRMDAVESRMQHAAESSPTHLAGPRGAPAPAPDAGQADIDTSDDDKLQPAIPRPPPPGEAWPVDDDEFQEEMQPFEAAAYGDSSSNSSSEEEDASDAEGDIW